MESGSPLKSAKRQRHVAFFGATGGCAATALALSLKHNDDRSGSIKCSALARNPEKLRSLLTSSPHNVSAEAVSANLTITKGDIRDHDAIRQTLTFGSSAMADVVIFGIGASPRLASTSIHLVTVDDISVCGDGMANVLAVLRKISSSPSTSSSLSATPSQNTANAKAKVKEASPTNKDGSSKAVKPLVAAISTTGISRRKRDVPLALLPLYRWLLAVPHKDKEDMERVLRDASASASAPASAAAVSGGGQHNDVPEKENLVDAVIIRPTLLVDGESSGMDKVRVGWEHLADREEVTPVAAAAAAKTNVPAPGPAVGYSVRRADVGAWMFEELVLGSLSGRERVWAGRGVTLSN